MKYTNTKFAQTQLAQTKFALTVDVEDWYQTRDFDFKSWDGFEDRIEKNVMRLLDLFSLHNVKATFFILGCAAGKHPGMVREIAKCGHEIGSHGMNHTLVTNQSREEFREDLLSSKAAIEDASGREVRVYRASSWSISESTLWALEVLEECGFTCDSSIQPFKTPLSGMRRVINSPFHPVLDGRMLKLVEFPSTILKPLGAPIPFCGGFYLRFWPYFMIKNWLKSAGRIRDSLVYCHPWEIDVDQPRIKAPFHIKMVHYYNLDTTYKKLNSLLDDFDFCPMGQIIHEKEYPTFVL